MRSLPITKTNFIFACCKYYYINREDDKNYKYKDKRYKFLALQYRRTVQKAPTKFFASQKSNFKWSQIFRFWVAYPRANYTTLN